MVSSREAAQGTLKIVECHEADPSSSKDSTPFSPGCRRKCLNFTRLEINQAIRFAEETSHSTPKGHSGVRHQDSAAVFQFHEKRNKWLPVSQLAQCVGELFFAHEFQFTADRLDKQCLLARQFDVPRLASLANFLLDHFGQGTELLDLVAVDGEVDAVVSVDPEAAPILHAKRRQAPHSKTHLLPP